MKDISHKEEYVKEIQHKLEKAGLIVLADCEGVTVSEMTELRRAVRQTKAELRVVKNTLVARALHNLNINELEGYMKGATAVTFGYDDPVAPVKALYDFTQKAKKFTFKAGYMDGKPLTVDQINALSKIPGRKELLSMLASAVQGPIRKLACLLDALRKKRDETAPAETAAPVAE